MGGRTSHNRRARLAGAACLLAVLCRAASGAETDQFLLWDRELADAAPEINAFLNDAVGDFLERANARSRPYRTPEAATIALFKYLFAGLHGSRVRTFVNTSPEVDRYPPRDTSIWRYQRMSLYHGLSFPFVLPMGRTVRVGEVYLGSDKFGHLLGFGRRYFQRYLRHRAHGASHDEAVDRVIDWGRVNEVSFVGGITDGIIAHADLEANYQGLRLALDCARGPAPYLARRDGQWVLTRPIDLRDYITPDFDESWNVCHFMGQRWRNVAPLLQARWRELQDNMAVRDRFAAYAGRGHGLARMRVEQHYARGRENPRIENSLRPPGTAREE